MCSSDLPAVAAQIAPFTEHLADTDVFWADPFDTASIAAALARATDQPALAVRTVLAVPAVCRRFSWAASARRHAQLYLQHRLTRAARCPP